MSKRYLNHVIMMSFSAVILGLGCSLFINANLGSDALTTLAQGFAKLLSIDIGMSNWIINGIYIVCVLIKKDDFHIGTIIVPAICSLSISVFCKYEMNLNGVIGQYLIFIIGLNCISLSIALNSKCDYGKNPYDSFCFSMSHCFQIKYEYVRTTIDLCMFAVGIGLGGKFGIGTLISVFCIGPVASLYMKKLDKYEFYNSFMQ